MSDSNMFKLNMSDVAKGAVTAVIAGIVISLGGVVSTPGFDLFAANWGSILGAALNAGFAAFVGYIGKNFLSDQNGKFMGKI